MFSSVLIANRGEIACRIIDTARKMSIRTVAVYSSVDANARHVRLADEAVYVGEAEAHKSYLDGEKIIAVAKKNNVEAIHPGYGFLSENAEFARTVTRAGLIFIGPPAKAIEEMGLKDAAKQMMIDAGVPVVPGYQGKEQGSDFLKAQAKDIGYPVLIKAVAGGGGKGMRKVERESEFSEALASAQREAMNAFGDNRVLIEKFIQNPRHVEIQVFADNYGEALYLFERDCSIQRRHQKIVEEAPAPGMPEEMRHAMGEAAVKAAKAVDYRGAGTVEFIVDASAGLQADKFWFMEMNTRLQVEHPVSEEITGEDLVAWQFKVAAGEKLPKKQNELAINGHALEVRLYAEDPFNGYLPSSGKLFACDFPKHTNLRIETGVETGDSISAYYDPMIAKLITWGKDRAAAITAMRQVLADVHIIGLQTNLGMLQQAIAHEIFINDEFDTAFVARYENELLVERDRDGIIACGLAALMAADNFGDKTPGFQDPFAALDAFQIGDLRKHGLKILLDGEIQNVMLSWNEAGLLHVNNIAAIVDNNRKVMIEDGEAYILASGRQYKLKIIRQPASDAGNQESGNHIVAPMHGKVIAIEVAVGDRVKKGDLLAVVEAMKMEHGLRAGFDAIVSEISGTPGSQVEEGAVLLRLEAPAD